MSRLTSVCVGLLALVSFWSFGVRGDHADGRLRYREGTRRLGDRRPTNAYGLPVIDLSGARVNYSPEELAGLQPLPRRHGARGTVAAGYTANWAYAGFGTAVGFSNIVVAANAGRREILLGGSTFLYDPDTYWYSLRFRAGGYEQTFVSPYLPEGIARIEVGDVASNAGNEIVVALQEGRVQVHALSDKALLNEIVTGLTDIRGLAVANVDADPQSEIVVCSTSALHVYSGTGALEWQLGGVGGQDLVAGQMDQDPALEVVLTDGSVVDTASRTVQWKHAPGFGVLVESADIDNDGRQELVIAESWQAARAFDVDLQQLKWSIPTAQDIGAIHLTDIDADGVVEMILGDGQWGAIHAFDTVSRAEEWEIPNPEHGVSDIAVADVDGDGQRELLWGAGATSSGSDRLYVVNWQTGALEWSNVQIEGPFVGPERADLDGDGKLELVVGSFESDSGYGSGRIVVFDATSLRVRAISEPIVGNLSWTGLHDLRLRDVDGDGRAEILVAADRLYDGVIEVYDFSPPNSFSLAWTNATRPVGASFRTVEAADIDDDGSMEIVGGVGREHTGAAGVFLYAYDYVTGSEEWRSPQLGGFWDAIAGLEVGDTDLDGGDEMVAMLETPAVHIFDGSTKALEDTITTQGTALRLEGLGVAPRITISDTSGDIARYEYLEGSYQEVYRQHFAPGAIDGFDVAPGGRFWLGHAGSLRLASSAGATLWQSADYGPLLGRYTLALSAKQVATGGIYSVVRFARAGGP